MNPSTYTVLFLSFFFVPLAIFSVVAIFARPLSESDADTEAGLEDYLISARDIKNYDYINSSAAYMLQVSTTFYFVFWGYNYGLSNIWYLLSWAVGILLFSKFAPTLILIRKKYETLPSFLASGRFSVLRYTSAVVTIFAFLAIFYVETYFCVDFVAILANPRGTDSPQTIWWLFFLILTFLTVIYSLFGGMRRVVITDRWQLSFAYACIAIVFAYLLPKSFAFAPLGGLTVAILMLALYGALIWYNHGLNNRPVVRISLLISFFILLGTTILSFKLPTSASSANFQIYGPFHQLAEPWGWVTLLGFTVVNILWQFCDNTAYQRIASLDLVDDPIESAKRLKSLISRLIIVSPLTWGLGIILGIAIRTSGVVAPSSGKEYVALLSSIKTAALAGDWFAIIAVLALSAALTSIMMETVDAALITFAQSFIRDIARDRQLKVPRLIGISIFAYAIVVVFALVHRSFPNASILTVMGGAYSALVVLSPAAILKMRGINVPDVFVIAAIVCGFALTWIATFGPVEGLPWNVKLVLPFFAASVGASVPILAGLVLRKA